MRRIAKTVLALLLVLAVLWGAAEAAPGSATVGRTSAETVLRAGTGNAGRSPAGSLRLEAKKNKNRKKKNTEAPAETAAPTPGKEAEDSAAPESGADPAATPVPEGPITDPQSIADYLFSHDMNLPDNFITKQEAQALGWTGYNYVSDVAPGKSIGGNFFGNYERKLPVKHGVSYREADCNYRGGRRRDQRVVYSPELRRVWYTGDHYETFTELFPTVP